MWRMIAIFIIILFLRTMPRWRGMLRSMTMLCWVEFCRLGKHSFLSGASLVMKDVLPFTKVAVSKDTYAKPFGLNTVGLRRRGFSAETIQFLKRGYRIIYREGLTIEQAIPKLQTMLDDCPEIALYIEAF